MSLRHSRRRWPIVERLGEQATRDLMRDSRSRATQRVLAERYGISLSSVKRLLRRVNQDHHNISVEAHTRMQ